MSRKDLQLELNRINELLTSQKKKAREEVVGGLTPELETQLNTMAAKARNNKISELGDDIQRMSLLDESVKVHGTSPSIDTTVSKIPGTAPSPVNQFDVVNSGGLDAVNDKVSKFRAARQAAGKKIASLIPFAGVGAGLLSGDPAMAAEELPGDIPILGQAYEAIRPSESGNPEEESMMLAERKALDNYKKSHAAQSAKYSKLNKLLGQ